MMRYILFWFWICMGVVARAQEPYAPAKEQYLAHTQWRYTYTTRAENNAVVQKAQKPWYVFFRYDQVLEMYQGDSVQRSAWQLSGDKRQLVFSYLSIHRWNIVWLAKDELILEHVVDTNQRYHYHFIPLAAKESPFRVPAGEIAPLELEHFQAGLGKSPHRFIKAGKGKRRINLPDIAKQTRAAKPLFIQIEMAGGGYSGGPDAVYLHTVVIHNDGRIVRQLQTDLQGRRVFERQISRQSLEDLAKYIVEKKHFFELPPNYACQTRPCLERLRQKPKPLAFRVAVTYGHRRKVIALPIWEGAHRGNAWIDYPEDLHAIIKAIEQIAQ